MIINGIGVDIVENRRIKQLLRNKKFIYRVFTENEIYNSKKVKDKTNYFSKSAEGEKKTSNKIESN